MDLTFLQAMVEDDEEINAYNAETFGMGTLISAHNSDFLSHWLFSPAGLCSRH